MKKLVKLFILFLTFNSLVSSANVCGTCGNFLTYTQGGWHTSCSGGNPGCYRDAHFSSAFPNGLTIGSSSGHTLLLTTSIAVKNFLPRTGSASILTSNFVNPTSCTAGVLGGQLVALTLNIGFDKHDPAFASSTFSLGDLILNMPSVSGINGLTVNQFLQLANDIVGGVSTAYSASIINTVATNINENFDNGIVDNGYLKCPVAPVLSVSAINNLCSNGTTGSVNLNVTEGTSPFIYLWSNGVQTQNLSNLTSGTYKVLVTDAYNFTATISAIVTAPSPIIVSSSQTNISCYGTATGSASLSVSGGTPPYTYSWSDSVTTSSSNQNDDSHDNQEDDSHDGTNSSSNSTTSIISNLSAGKYTATIKDANGCTSTKSVTITQPIAILSASISSQTNATYYGASNGAASISVSGGTSPYSYLWSKSSTSSSTNHEDDSHDRETNSWSNSVTTPSISGLSVGTYTVTITDVKGCTVTKRVLITQPAQLIASVVSQINETYYGGTTGSVTVTAIGGISPYTWSKNGINFQANPIFTGLSAGTVTFTCKDANGIIATVRATITQPAQLIASVVSQTNETYYGGTTGNVTVSASGGISPYTWSKDGINYQSSPTFSGLVAGTYTISCKDSNSYVVTKSITITQPAQLVVSVLSQTNETYYGGTTGSVTVTAIGGISPYTWSKNGINFQSNPVFSGLAVGTYIFTCKDANGITATTSATIMQPDQLVPSIVSQTNETYYGGSTGSVTLSATGGVTPYTWSKDGINYQSSSTFSGLLAGTYTFSCKDANNYVVTKSVTITQPAQLVVSVVSQTNVGCYGTSTGSVTFSAIGGVSPYTWSKDGINYQGSSTFSSLSSGAYTLNCKDANGYIKTQNFTITQPNSALSASITTNSNCISGNNGSATVTAIGGTGAFTYLWNTSPSQTLPITSGLSAGTYTVTVTDANRCSTSQSITINGVPQDFAYTTNYQATTQSLIGNSFTFTEFGSVAGETYNWDFGDGNTSTLGTPTKSYSNYGIYNARLIATNAGGCSDTTYQTVVVLAPSKSAATIPVCACGSNPTTVSQTIIFPTSTTDWSGTNLKIRNAAKFNSSLGNLTGVKIITNSAFTTHNKAEITGSMGSGSKRLVSIQTTGIMDCGAPGFLYGINPAMILDTFYSTGFDGIKDFVGTSGRDFGYHTSSNSDSTSFIDSTTLASYIGNDSVSFSAFTNTNMSASFPTGNDTMVMQTTATDTITLIYYYCNPVISSVKTGNWNDPTTWDVGRVPTACDNVHIRNTDSVSIPPTYHAACANILCDGRSKLYIYDTLDCKDFINDSANSVTKVYGQLNVCSMVINHGSNVYACSNINFSNCTNKLHPLEVLNSAHLNPLGGIYCSIVTIKLKIDTGNVDLTNLCSANVGIQTLTITNATVTLAACNNIVDYIILNTGGDCIGSTPTWTGVSKLALNRNYNLDTTSILWQAGSANVPHSIDILSGNINVNAPKTVITRMQLLGGIVYGGTNLIFANNSYLFRCGGILNQPASMGTNVTVEMCSDTNTSNPPAIIGSKDMPITGFTGNLIISTNVILGGNILVPYGKVRVTKTGILNDSNFIITSATSVQVDSGGTVYTSKNGGLAGSNSLVGSIPITLDPKSTVIFDALNGTQTITPLTSYGNIVCTNSSAKVFPVNSTTTIYGNVTNTGTGTISGTSGSTVNFVGTNQFVAGIAYYNVNFNGSGTTTMTGTSSVAANMNMNVSTGVIVQTNNNLTLLSGPSGTAQVGPLLNGADVLGNVCWLRYIPGGASNRRWRFLSCPIKNVIFKWWQNDIFITGPGTGGTPCAWNTTSQSSMVRNSNGFDQNASGVYSCFTWNEPSATWQTIGNTNDTINPLVAYRTFVRGDRNIEGCILMTNMPDSVSSVTLRSCGPIVKFTQTTSLTYTSGIGNGWNYVSNPYPCSIDWWNSTWRTVRSSSINNFYYIWAPTLNQYATWSPTAGGTLGATNLIGTGQSFFIKTTALANLVFEEAYKLDSGQIGFFGKTSTSSFANNLKITMKSSSSRDEAIIYLKNGATSNYEDTYDALKMGYVNGSIASSTKVNASKLVINGIAPTTTIDTILLNTYLTSTTNSYTFNFTGGANFDPQYILLLKDKYLSVITNLTGNSAYSFTTITGVAASYNQKRFELYIMNSSSLPVTLVNFTANKKADKTVLVKWTTASEINNSHFIIEYSTDATNFTQLEVVKGAGNATSQTNYSFIHTNPVSGMNYYRLTQVDNNNATTVSNIVAVNMSDEILGAISLFPVPANNELNINFGNAQFSGNVSIKIFDMIGRQIINKQLSVNSKNQVSTIDISKLNSGTYFINVTSQNGTEQNIKFIKD